MGLTAREYLRVSQDRSGRERSITEQQDDNRRVWADQVSSFGEPYTDVSIPASRYSTVPRGNYNKLLSDLDAGRFESDLLILWEGSRGSRRVGEWVDLIELCEDRKKRIAVTIDERIYDPANARDRKSLIDSASDAEYESAKISGRTKRAAAASAAQGRPHGPTPFGYRRKYDPVTRKLEAQEPNPGEAPIVQELFDRIVKGHSLHSIARDFEGRGVLSRHGTPFTPQVLRQMLGNIAYLGMRVHVAGRRNAHNWDSWKHGEIIKGQWVPLVDEVTWLSSRKVLDRNKKRERPARATYLLSLIAKCDVCGGFLATTSGKRQTTRTYRCRYAGHVLIGQDGLDELVEDVVVAYLSAPKNIDWMAPEQNGEAEQAREGAARIRAELDDLADRLSSGEITAGLAAKAEPGIQQRLRRAERRVEELSTPGMLQGLIHPGEGVRQRWGPLDIEVKRKILKLLLTPEILGELRVTRGRGLPVEARLVWQH